MGADRGSERVGGGLQHLPVPFTLPLRDEDFRIAVHSFQNSFLPPLRRFNRGCSLQQCAVKFQPSVVSISPQSQYSISIIGGTFTYRSNNFYISFAGYPGYLVRCQPHFQLSTFPRNNHSRQCRAWTRLEFLEIVRRSQFESCRRTAADSLLDLDISCV